MNINNLSLEEKIGQMILVGINKNGPISVVEDLILKYKVGGIMIYRKNYNNYSEMIELINYIKKLNSVNKIPLLIAIDQEGGRVNRLPKEFLKMPSPYSIAQKDYKLIGKSSEITSQVLKNTGINMNFAPSLDIKRFREKHAIGDRCISENREKIVKAGKLYIEKHVENEVVPVIKHFPGHGVTKRDTHVMISITNKNLSELENEDMYPFKELIHNGADVILASHIKILKMDKINPTSFSKKIICTYLRGKFRFKGIIITDDLRMKAISLRYGSYKPILKALKSGNDIVLFKSKNKDKIFSKIYREIEKNKIKEYKINKSVKRILELKEKYMINDELIEENEKTYKEYNDGVKYIEEQIGK